MKKPLVGIVMGSDTDLPVMQEAAKVLEAFGIPFEITLVSAHRTPERLLDYSKSAVSRGLKTIIAGAGGAAHLPGMVASLTPLPVIGVPVNTTSLSSLGGLDSLLSIVQMPGGVPVATVAINNAKNAGILAAQILGTQFPEIQKQVTRHKEKMKQGVTDKAASLEKQGALNTLKKASKKKA